jgi:hypothetical protein
MLPGFRFLFAAIVLSMSILIFGLGAAALLRAAHEEFASAPTWRAAPETVFAQPAEATRPVLALLRVDTPVTDKAPEKVPDNAPAETAPTAITSALAEPEPVAAPDRIAALKPEDSPLPQSAKPEDPVAETPVVASPAQNEAASAPADVPAPVTEIKAIDTKVAATQIEETKIEETKNADTGIVATGIVDTKVATTEEAPLPAIPAAAPAAPEPTGAQALPEADAPKIATLGGPAVATETPRPVKPESTKPDPNAIKKRQQAKRAARRRALAAPARVTAQIPQQPANPFGQPAPMIVHTR